MIIIANILSLVANILCGVSSFFKKKKTILLVQTTECCLGSLVQILAGNPAAAVELLICALRNFVTSKGLKAKWVYWLFSIFFLGFGLLFNNNGLIGFLPVIATIQYTLWLGYSKTAQAVRYGMILNYIPWIIHDFMSRLYISAGCMTVFLCLTIVNIIRYKNIEKSPLSQSED